MFYDEISRFISEHLTSRNDLLLALVVLALLVAALERSLLFGRRLWRKQRDFRALQHQMTSQLGSEEFHQHVWKYVDSVDPARTCAAFDPWRDIARVTQSVEVAFESEGLEWYLAHANVDDVSDMINMARDLGMEDMTAPLYDLQPWFGWETAPESAHITDTEHPEYRAIAARLAAIQTRFDALGGVDRFRQTACDQLRADVPDILAVRRA